MQRAHENYRELVWMLAKTDFKLRYHGSVLGYVWALLKPLITFAILNFVFSALFVTRGIGGEYYALQLLVAVVLFNFFSEGTSAGLNSLVLKSQLVTKIYVPRWTIILAATLNAAMIFCMNLIIIALFFAWQGFLPSTGAMLSFVLFALATYLLILIFSFFTAPLYVKFRDLSMIWEVLLPLLFYATPVFYPLQLLPLSIQQALLVNPMAFIIHFTKEALTNHHYAEPWQYALFAVALVTGLLISLVAYRRWIPRVAENM